MLLKDLKKKVFNIEFLSRKISKHTEASNRKDKKSQQGDKISLKKAMADIQQYLKEKITINK